MKNKVFPLILTVLLISVGCNTKDGSCSEEIEMSERESYLYDNTLAEVKDLETLYAEVKNNPTPSQILLLTARAKELKYNYNNHGMNSATVKHCDSLKNRVERFQAKALAISDELALLSNCISMVNITEQLFDKPKTYPVYLKKGEKLFVDISSSSSFTAKIYNANTEKLIKSYRKGDVCDSITVNNTSIYLLEFVPRDKQYVDISLAFRPVDSSGFQNRPAIISEQVECNRKDMGAVAVPGVKMQSCFEEPRKFTLRGGLKATLSGSPKNIVAVKVPAGTTDILYSLRVDTSEGDKSEDGEFHSNLTHSYKRIKFLGLPIYERNASNGLLNSLLDDNRPIRDEDAYCNMYVFRRKSQAKKFQDRTKTASMLDYDVDYSTLGTQSCNGRIPTNGMRTIYLGFENVRVRYTAYFWLEVEAVVPTTIYYRTKYTIK